MFSRTELLDAIDELEMSPATYQNCEKLATFYSLYDHLYSTSPPKASMETEKEIIVGKHGDSDFLRLVEGKNTEYTWSVIDELMETIKALQPKLYEATLRRFRD